jgi:formate hydrogenlyase subunit 6/NADH:ubiquinone oxidoreductase subunit I
MKECNHILPEVDESLCTLCGLCAEVCRCGVVTMGEKGPIFKLPSSCSSVAGGGEAVGGASCSCCYLCEEVCPTGAIRFGFEIVLGEEERTDDTAGGAGSG